MADFVYEDLLPIGADETPYRLLTTDGRARRRRAGRAHASSRSSPEALRLLTETAMHDIAHYLRPGAPAAAAPTSSTTRRRATTTSSSRSTCSRTPTSPPAACCRCARTPARRSSWASAASTCSRRARDERGDQPRACTTPTPASTCATRRWRRSRRGRRRTPAPTCPAQVELYADTARRATRRSTSSSSWPRAAARPTRATSTRRPRRSSTPTR